VYRLSIPLRMKLLSSLPVVVFKSFKLSIPLRMKFYYTRYQRS